MSEITEDYEDWDRADLVREAEDLATDLRSKEKTIREQAKELLWLREDGDATRERSNGWAVAAVEAARCADERDAIIAEQAKEIERLQNFRCACCDGPMYVPDACAECRDD